LPEGWGILARTTEGTPLKRNIELKARFPNLDAGYQTARRLGAQLHAIERQLDTYFRVASGRLKLRERWSLDSSGVLQRPCASQLIWYQRPDNAQTRASDYSLIVVEHGEQMREVLAGSLGVVAEIEKHRTVYLHDNVRIHLDEVRGLGMFLEFEAIVDDRCAEAAAKVKLEKLFSEFQLTSDSVIAGSYSDLLRC
jgi:adenylate cyclase, class 2